MLANGDAQAAAAQALLSNGSSQHQNGKGRARHHTQGLPPSALASASSYAATSALPTTYFGHDPEEVTRILIQGLVDLGYTDAAQSVIQRSGYSLESPAVTEFRKAILDGDWYKAERLLLGGPNVSVPDGSSGSNGNGAISSNVSHADGRRTPEAAGILLVPGTDRSLMQFSIRQQKYLELLEQRETAKALVVLRTELTPLYNNTTKLHFLSSLLMCQTPQDIKDKAGWDGVYGQSRRILLSELSRCISPTAMLPAHRLAVLLDEVQNYQVSVCLFHTKPEPPSLYVDHHCDGSDFPSQVLLELDGQCREVWQIRFSHDGTKLASCGSDRPIFIWDVPSFKMLMKLDGHDKGVGNLAWSPDDSKLVSCGRDNSAQIWDMKTGLLERPLRSFDEPVSCCVWPPDGQSIILGSFDKEHGLGQYNLKGEIIFDWAEKHPHRTEDMALSPNSQWLVAIDYEKRIYVYDFAARELEYEIELNSRVLSIDISADSQFLLVYRQDGEIHLHSLEQRGNVVHIYTGGSPADSCVIRCAFGGANESYVVSGSGDGKLNIWHKTMGIHMFKLDAHKPRCNAMCWSPIDPCLFVTCGDDGKIKIWGSGERARQRRELDAGNGNGGSGHSSSVWRSSMGEP